MKQCHQYKEGQAYEYLYEPLMGCERERERELHLSSHTRLMQVLPGHPLADQEYTIRESELHVRQILVVTTRGLKDRIAFRQNKQSKGVNYM